MPTLADIRKLFRRVKAEGKETTIVTCTRRAAQQINELVAAVVLGKRRTLVELLGEYDANPENYDDRGKLRTDRQPVPTTVHIKKGLRLHLTKNLDKQGDYVNGMECVVQSWDAHSKCLHVKTITGRDVAVFWYTDPNPEAQGCSYFPIRLGYASTLYKMQGAELRHVTIHLDKLGHKAAAYVAMSRVKSDDDYLFGGRCRRKHFVPNV